jgi:uncharacterized protein YgbK (DUF1537 family)
MGLGVVRIFKKTDSVLRGHVAAELEAQRMLQGKSAILLCPANPAGGRKIIDGHYYIDSIPLHRTGFANDPEFPAITSDVQALLRQRDDTSSTSSGTLMLVNAASCDDLRVAAARATEEVVPAGSAAFFEAWLSGLNLPKAAQEADTDVNPFLAKTTLIVCGSAFRASVERVQAAQKQGAPVFYISPLWAGTPQLAAQLQRCADATVQALRTTGRAIVAVDRPTLEGKEAAAALRDATAQIAEKISQAVTLQELVVEGGATAFAIIRRLGFSRFLPVREFAPGVVRMSVQGHGSIHLTIKPGSYEFPKEIMQRE